MTDVSAAVACMATVPAPSIPEGKALFGMKNGLPPIKCRKEIDATIAISAALAEADRQSEVPAFRQTAVH